MPLALVSIFGGDHQLPQKAADSHLHSMIVHADCHQGKVEQCNPGFRDDPAARQSRKREK